MLTIRYTGQFLLAVIGVGALGMKAAPQDRDTTVFVRPNDPVPEGLVLQNEAVKAVFSTDNGALIGLMNKKTQWRVHDRPELGLSFQLLVPLPDRRNNPVFGDKQKLRSFDLSADGTTAHLYWHTLAS